MPTKKTLIKQKSLFAIMQYIILTFDEPGRWCWMIDPAVDKIDKMIIGNKEYVGVNCDKRRKSIAWV